MDLSAIRNPVLGYNAYNLTAGAARFGTTDARHFNSSSSDPVLYFNCYSGFLASALPLGISNCSLGMYCPNISLDDVFTWPQVCPPSIDCQASGPFFQREIALPDNCGGSVGVPRLWSLVCICVCAHVMPVRRWTRRPFNWTERAPC